MMKKAHAQFPAESIKILLDIYNSSKKLSDYAKNIKPEDEVFFEKVKNGQLLKASSKDTEWLPMFERVEEIGAVVSLFSYFSKKINPPSRKQIYFWAMQQAYNESMYLGMDTDITQQLEMDMIMAYLQFAVDGMDIAAEAKLELQKAMDEIASKDETIDALERVNQHLENVKHPPRPKLKIIDAAAACKVTTKTISRWEKYRKGKKGGTKPPDWYPGLNVTTIELRSRKEDAQKQEDIAKANRRGVKNASRYNEERDRPADDDE